MIEDNIETDALGQQTSMEEEQKNDELRLSLQAELEESKDEFIRMCEDYFSEHGEGDIKDMAQKRKDVRYKLDSIGKIVQTKEGDGTAFNPYKTWSAGTEVYKGEWWMTDDGYLWEAIKDGIPASSTDKEYWDIVE